MCGRYVSATPPDQIAAYFGTQEPEVLLPASDNPMVNLGLFSVPRNPAIAFGVIASGIPVYLLWERFRNRRVAGS